MKAKLFNEKYKENYNNNNINQINKKKNVYSDDSSISSEENDEIEETKIEKKKIIPRRSRNSVSAEVYGLYNKKENFVPKEYQKTQEQIIKIKERISQNIFFSNIEPNDMEILIKSFCIKKYSKETIIINQGDEGENFFLVDSGELNCFKTINKKNETIFLKNYNAGESFGELALLYNAPRAATVQAKTDCVLFVLDRECFNHIVKSSTIKKRLKYENFLKQIEILESIDPYERSQIADALKPAFFKKGEYILKEGDIGDTFYFIEEGYAIATKKQNNQEIKVYSYKPGDYFGELALLKDTPRAANIIAETDIKLVGLERHSFKRMIGPLEEILKRNFKRYEKFVLN